MQELAMPDIKLTQRFEALVETGQGDPAALARVARQGDVAAAIDLAALFTRAGWVEPETIIDVYDAASASWFGEDHPPVDLTRGTGRPAPQMWAPFWDFIDDTSKMDPGGFTTRVAQLGFIVGEGFGERAGRASLAFPGVPDAVAQGWPPKFTMDELALCPEGSLGHEFRRQIVDNNFDLEVLDRDALGLAQLPPPLDYLNARALQCHDLWHIVGGYYLTALHETAISGFQMAQFGHNYSAQYLAFIVAKTAVMRPEGIPLVLEITLSGWRHGRGTPSLLGIDWQGVWSEPTDKVRQRLGVSAYNSPVPADLVEQLERAGLVHGLR
jgi:ubiquinone biosynthesis protein Coq4